MREVAGRIGLWGGDTNTQVGRLTGAYFIPSPGVTTRGDICLGNEVAHDETAHWYESMHAHRLQGADGSWQCMP
jgi:hypothetical protein